MAADISALGNLQPIEPLDMDNYADNKEAGTFSLPPKGVYTVRATASPTFDRSKTSGALLATIDPVIVSPTNEGFIVRFTKVSAKEFKRGTAKVTQMTDYLRACGVRGKFSDEQELADAVEATANTLYQIEGDWSAYNKDTKVETVGMERFPSDGNGGHLPWIEATDAMGAPIRLRANFKVTRYIPASA